jgi:hypothetical protein
LRRSEYQDGVKVPEGEFLLKEYHFDREFAVTPEDQAKLFHPKDNFDLDYLVLARNHNLVTHSQ